MIETARVHASCVAVTGEGPALGVLVFGPSGSGKSDVALRLIDDGWHLVADDQVLIARTEDGLVARAPTEIYRLLEVRGVGLVKLDALASARLVLAVELVAPDAVPRLPEPAWRDVCGGTLPLLRLWALEASTPAKIRLAARLTTQARQEGVTFPFENP